MAGRAVGSGPVVLGVAASAGARRDEQRTVVVALRARQGGVTRVREHERACARLAPYAQLERTLDGERRRQRIVAGPAGHLLARAVVTRQAHDLRRCLRRDARGRCVALLASDSGMGLVTRDRGVARPAGDVRAQMRSVGKPAGAGGGCGRTSDRGGIGRGGRSARRGRGHRAGRGRRGLRGRPRHFGRLLPRAGREREGHAHQNRGRPSTSRRAPEGNGGGRRSTDSHRQRRDPRMLFSDRLGEAWRP